MKLSNLTAISPLDGRYASKTIDLRELASEYALIRSRLQVEIYWFCHLADQADIPELPSLQHNDRAYLQNIIDQFDESHAQTIKQLEATTNHDVKAVEYFVKQAIADNPNLQPYTEFVHFACTSEDINNIAYALMLQTMRDRYYIPQLKQLTNRLQNQAYTMVDDAMLGYTHGQPASPTTMGKELANFAKRLQLAKSELQAVPIKAKCNGAVGNYNAHALSYPQVDWPQLCQQFIEDLGLTFQPYSTQIEPHDYIAQLSHQMAHINTIVIDCCRDIWHYIAWGYFQQHHQQNEVGSSTMPHKINPIDFENAEGNAGLANALWYHFAQKLPISRFQRDLSDSTVLRNLGSAIAYSELALQSLIKGLGKIAPNQERMQNELDKHWEVLAEALQTIMRRYQISQPYEKLKQLTRGQDITPERLHEFIDTLAIPQDVKNHLKSLRPSDYIGYAAQLACQIE